MTASARSLCIQHLQSGGLITNYRCTSRCRHCLYGCSSKWPHDVIDDTTARASLETIRSLGCRTIHIGGGEPFLDVEALRGVLEIARETGVHVEYVETNSSWYRDQESTCAILGALKEAGLTALLISMSPFHNEFIPFYKVKGVSSACLRTGVRAFPWIKAFYREIDSFDDGTTHSLPEYVEKFGADYLARIPSRYWIHLGGRALGTFREVLETLDCRTILAKHPQGCSELADVSHFHIDLYGRYIPGLCTGLAIRREDLGQPLDPARYPLLTTLYAHGINGLVEMARRFHDYRPQDRYLSKCDLCFDVRRHILDHGDAHPELHPARIYTEATSKIEDRQTYHTEEVVQGTKG